MQVPVDDIIVKKRIRKEMGDIAALAESLKRYGQISPIVVNKKNILIAGGRRLAAAKQLGWRTINVIISDNSSELERLEREIEENVQRRDFSMEEVAEASKKLYRLQNPCLLRRIWDAIVLFFKKLFRIEYS